MSDLIPQHTDEVVLYRDEDQRELDRLDHELAAAAVSSNKPMRLGDDDAVMAAARAFDEFKSEAVKRGVVVAIKAMPGRRWRALVGQHPPRDNHEGDADWGFNHLTLADVVVAPCIVSIGGRVLEGQALEDALDAMNDGDFSKVYAHVLHVNTGQGPDPKDSISERLPRTSSETSASAERLG